MLDLKSTPDDQRRLKTNILPGEADALVEYVRNYDAEQRMQDIMEAPQLSINSPYLSIINTKKVLARNPLTTVNDFSVIRLRYPQNIKF
jgi:hypothetical protein